MVESQGRPTSGIRPTPQQQEEKRMKRALWILLAFTAAICVTSLPAVAGTIFDDFGAGNSYTGCTRWTVSGPTSPPGQFISANEFTAGGGGGTVSTVDIAIG